MTRSKTLVVLFLSAMFGTSALSAGPAHRPSNILVILSDDVGYGDLGCYGATKVKTPNLDRLAAGGLRFTDAHSTASTCTPSRYSIMTGQYAWRKKGTGILPGDAALIVDPDKPTMPSILQHAGYATGCVGKWHLGLGTGDVDWNGEIKPGPNEIGFDYSFIIPATGDRVPCVFIENRHVVGGDPNDPILVSYKHKVGNEPTGKENPELLKMKLSQGHDATIINGISRIGWMTGGKFARWKDEQIAEVLTQHAVTFIEQNKDKPFFLYFATHDIHVPRAPGSKFVGTSECGVRGDVIQELDWSVGEVMATLDRLKLTENTLVIFSSDNGPVVDDGYADGAQRDLNGHTPAGPLRGGKYTIWEGGTRMPFIVSQPRRVKPGVSDALISQIDFAPTFAAYVGATVPAGAAPDGVNVLPALLGDTKTARETLVEQSGILALRKGNWKLIQRKGQAAKHELYDLTADLGETKNVAADHPEIVKEMSELLAKEREHGGAVDAQ
jgi:arylsulfatase A-like enzyme